MKKNLVVTLVLMLAGMLALNAQDDNPCWGETEAAKTLCREAYSIWQGDYKQGTIDQAHASWLKVRELCPLCVGEKPYTEGAKYYKSFVKENKDNEEIKELYVDSLLMIYKQRMEYFPKKTSLIQGYIGSTILKYRPEQYDEAQKYLMPSVESLKEKSSPTNIQAYYSTIAKQFSQAVEAEDTMTIKSKKIELLKTFVDLDQYTQGAIDMLNEKGGAKNQGKAEKYETMRTNLLKIFLQLDSNCESLEKLVMENLYKEGDSKSCKTALTILTLKECTNGENYPSLAECSDDGTHGAAYGTAIVYLKSQNYPKSEEWFEIALERCPDCESKEDYLLRAGQTANIASKPSKAKSYARQILEINSKSADAYLILADAWTKSDCGDKAFGKACSFWIAYDYYAKAKSLDSSLADKANKSMSAIKSGWPSKGDVNKQGLSIGGTYTCCGISTKIRTRD